MIATLWSVLRTLAAFYLLASMALVVVVLVALVYHQMIANATARRRRTVDPSEAWKDEPSDYDVATGSHPQVRGIAPHGLGPKCDHATHSPFVRLSDFDESALRVLVELDNERHEGAA